MQDQLFMRHWVAHHQTFSRDVDKGFAALARALRRVWRPRLGIDRAYGPAATTQTKEDGAGPAGQAMLAGIAASLATSVLFSGTAFLILPAGAVA